MQETHEQNISNARSVVLRTFAEMKQQRLDLHSLFEAAGNDPADRESVLDAVEQLKREGILESQGSDFYSLTEKGARVRARQNRSSGKAWVGIGFTLFVLLLALAFLVISPRILRHRINQSAPPSPGESTPSSTP
jgi:hypothetical protein